MKHLHLTLLALLLSFASFAVAPITGVTSLCTGYTTNLTDATTGGTWSSGNTTIATVGSSGVVTGILAGTATISYDVSGVYATTVVTVNTTPATITGYTTICIGSTSCLTDVTPGGTWTSSSTTVAIVGSSTGCVTGIVATTAIISYTLSTGCQATDVVTVAPLPVVGGITSVCVGLTTSLFATISGVPVTGDWTSSNTSIATAGFTTGIVTGVSASTATITYTYPSTGCMATIAVTVMPNPPTPTGSSFVCVGGSTPLSDGVSGGTWTSENLAVASVSFLPGVVSGISAGVDTITYTLGTGCYSSTTITVNGIPPTITGTTGICVGSTSTLSDAGTGGTWSSSNTSIATVGSSTGIVTGVTAGTAVVSYIFPTGCYKTITVTVHAVPLGITGSTGLCIGSTTALTDATGGGTWASSNTAIATIGASTGIVTGVSLGTATITYKITSTGCMSTTVVTVNPLPGLISGTKSICVGTTSTLSDGVGGGTWACSNTSVATIGITSGVLTGVSPGTAVLTYALGLGCTVSVTATITPIPVPISGFTSLCVGSVTVLSDATGGGAWSSANTSVAVVGVSSGIVTGMSGGTATISYALGSCSVSTIVTVYPLPLPLSGPSSVCAGGTITLSDAVTGGTWSSSNSAVASVGSTVGNVTGVSPGTATVTYSIGSGCGVLKTVTVVLIPSVIIGPTGLCIGSPIALSDATSGGTWSSSNTVVATVGVSSGIVLGMSVGTAIISYTIGGMCSVTQVITVYPTPSLIYGPSSVCAGGTITLSDAVTGGTWSSSNSTIVSVGSTVGNVTGVMAGTASITYSLGSGCMVFKTVTVLPNPSLIIGTTGLCTGSTATLTDATPGGTWSSSNTTVATIGSTGIATGVSTGTADITYTIGGMCYTTMMITINPIPATISGTATVCVGSTTTLSNATTGGAWSSSTSSIATIGSSGTVTGVATGTATISYTLGTGCFASMSVTVDPLLTPAISISPTPGDTVCPGTTVTFTAVPIGGGLTPAYTWYVNGIATGGSSVYSYVPINNDTVVLTMSSSYICKLYSLVSTGLGMTVNYTTPISGSSTICAGATVTLSDATTGGTWSSSSSAIATVGVTSGIAAGVTAGTAIITYLLPTGCYADTALTINPLPTITTSSSSGCGNMDTLNASGGSTYSWVPITGLSCTSCATTAVSPSATTTYTVTGTSSGCSDTASITVNGNRIFGYITFGGATPDTLDMKVWLIQFNPTDSSIIALDSTTTCTVDSIGYYEFDGEAAGNYLTKAKLRYGNVPGSSGYVPTYSLSTPNWYAAATAAHTSGSDSLHISMVYGTVPAGPGFIAGYVYAGAGKGTSGEIPVQGMLIYLEDNSNNVFTYTYTDSSGAYSFAGLAYDNFIIYPEDYDYNTTPSNIISLSTTNPTVSGIDFKQYNNSRIIVPYTEPSNVQTLSNTPGINVYPNPAAGILNIQWQNQAPETANMSITDIIGRKVYESVLNINSTTGQTQINLEDIKDGIYLISVKSDNIYYSGKLIIQQ